MFDLNGNVIGINSALISPTGASVGIGLAIPAELAKPVIDALAKGQRPSRGYLGVGLQPLDEDLAPSLGLPKNSGEIVRSLVPDGPAARGGLQQGDVIVTRQRPAGHARRDRFLPDRQHPGRFASAAGDHPRRQARDGHRHGRRASDRGSAFEDRRRRGDHAGQRTGAAPVAPQRALGLALAPLTPELARAANLPADSARRDRHLGRPEQRRRRSGASARRSRRFGQQPAGDHAGPGHRHRRRGAQGGPHQGAVAGQARAIRPRRSSESTSAAARRASADSPDVGVIPLAAWRPYPASRWRTRTASAPSESAW